MKKKKYLIPCRRSICAGMLGLILAAACGSGMAQTGSVVNYASGTYLQDFSGLSTLPLSSFGTAGTPFAFGDTSTFSGATGLAGWYGEASAKNVYQTQLGTPGATTGGFTAFGSGATPQALGLKSTSTSGIEMFGLDLVNSSSLTLTTITVSFDAEAWWAANGTRSKDLQFGYSLGGLTFPALPATDATPTGYQSALSFSGTTSSNAGTLTLASDNGSQSSVIATGSDSTINGTAPGNFLTLSETISGINWTPGTTLWLTWDYSDLASTSPGLGIGDLAFSASAGGFIAQNLTWNVSSGAWDTTTPDWTGTGGVVTTYADTDNVTFGGTGGVVTIAGTGVSPGSVNVTNNSGTYTFAGGPINGTGAVTMSGSGVLVLTGSNGYSGGASLTAGTTRISNDNALGAASGALIFSGGTLQTTASITSSRNVSVNTGGGTIDTNGSDSTFSGLFTINDTFVKKGLGNLILNGAVNSTASGSTTGPATSIVAGTLTLGQSNGTINLYADNTGTAFAGNLVITGTGGPRINFNTGIVGGGGQIQVQGSGVLLSNNSGDPGAVINNNIVLNSGGAAFTKGDVTQAVYVPGSFVSTIGGTKGGGLVINGVISGNSDLNIGNDPVAGGGAGFVTLNAQNTYTGATMINTSKATITMGANNALPVTTDLINSTESGATGVSTLDLAGFSQRVNSLSTGTAGGTLIITNNGAGTSTLTVSGSTTPANAFSGFIADGTNGGNVALVKAGSGSLTLTGINTYSGSTTIAGGSLILSGNGTVGSGNIMLAGGTLDVSQVSGGQYSINGGQTLGGSGIVNLGATTLSVSGILNSGLITVSGGTLSLTSLASFQLTLGSPASGAEINLINGGVLDIGNGTLGMNSFTFSETTGFAPGTYTLIAATALAPGDSLNSGNLTGIVDGYNATLGMTGDDITLTVVPEPGTVFLIVAGLGAVLVFHRLIRRQCNS